MGGITHLTKEVKAWIKRKNGPDEILRVVPSWSSKEKIFRYRLLYAYAEKTEDLGCILFDAEGYWIYDGDVLSVEEQEQLARFIMNYVEVL